MNGFKAWRMSDAYFQADTGHAARHARSIEDGDEHRSGSYMGLTSFTRCSSDLLRWSYTHGRPIYLSA